jgi:hypothetical protein
MIEEVTHGEWPMGAARQALRAKRRILKERDNETMQSVRAILNNQKLAKEAYPNPQIRANIIPFVRAMRRQADRLERQNKRRRRLA